MEEDEPMTEKEKMLAGMIYDANYDKNLIQERLKCKDLCYEFNQLRPSQIKEQTQLIREIFGKTKESFYVLSPFWCDYGYNIEIGENFFMNHNCVILDCAKVTFGDNVFIAPDCGFYTAGHPMDAERRNQGLEYARPIIVGDNVWIGGGVHVMPGVTIGNDTVIAGGSIVTRDIPDHVLAGGNPCRVIRPLAQKFSEDDLDQVMAIWLQANMQAHEFISADYWESNAKAVRQMIPASEVYVCKENQQVTGFIGLTDDYIAGIFVDAVKRSQGIGKVLLNHAKQMKKRLTLHVYQKNEKALHFYLREGFQIGHEQTDENTGETELLMVWEENREK